MTRKHPAREFAGRRYTMPHPAPVFRETAAPALFGRNHARPTIGPDRDIGEHPLGHLDRLGTEAAPDPGRDPDPDRGPSDPLDHGIATDLVPDQHRLVKGHRLDSHGGDPAPGPVRRNIAPGNVHLGQQPATEDVTARIGIGGHCRGSDRRSCGEFRNILITRIVDHPLILLCCATKCASS